MAVIGATAAAQHVDLRMATQQLAVLAAQLHRIAGIEVEDATWDKLRALAIEHKIADELDFA